MGSQAQPSILASSRAPPLPVRALTPGPMRSARAFPPIPSRNPPTVASLADRPRVPLVVNQTKTPINKPRARTPAAVNPRTKTPMRSNQLPNTSGMYKGPKIIAPAVMPTPNRVKTPKRAKQSDIELDNLLDHDVIYGNTLAARQASQIKTPMRQGTMTPGPSSKLDTSMRASDAHNDIMRELKVRCYKN